jgi:hypothetical protein
LEVVWYSVAMPINDFTSFSNAIIIRCVAIIKHPCNILSLVFVDF